jgi:hypothetical protein
VTRQNKCLAPLREKEDGNTSLSEEFDEYVCNLLYSRIIEQIDDLLLNQPPDKIHVDVDVFGPLMINQVLQDLDGVVVVTIDDLWILHIYAKFNEDILNPNNLSGNINNP